MKRILATLASLLVMSSAIAQEVAPDVLVKGVTDDVLAIVRADKDIQSGNTHKAVALAEAKVLPHFNFPHMTALAVGKEWRQATPAQQKSLIDEFRTLLVRTYSKALTEYRSQTINFKPLKMAASDTEAVVRSVVNQPGSKPVQIDYNLERTEQGWKVYDIAVDGISFINNHRNQFNAIVQKEGINGLIKNLAGRNAAARGNAVVSKR